MKNTNQTIQTVRDALLILESSKGNLEYLREVREGMITSGGPHWSYTDSAKYDAILAAIEILTNPVFRS